MKNREKLNRAVEHKFRNQLLECQIVAYILRHTSQVASVIDPEWFSCVIFRHLITLAQKLRTVVSKSIIVQELRSSKLLAAEDEKFIDSYLKDVYKVSLSTINEKNIHIMIHQLYELSESRRCLKGIKSIIQNIKSWDLNKAKKQFRDLGRVATISDETKSGNYLDDYERRVEIIASLREKSLTEEATLAGIPTGIDSFDRLIGGVMPGEFGVIAGRPAIGKTAFLNFVALQAWLSGTNVLFATGEMAKDLLQFRFDSSLAGIPSQKFRVGDLSKKDLKKWNSKIESLRATQQSFLEVVAFPRDFTTENLEMEALRVQEKHGKLIGLFCIDYLNIMDSVKSRGNNSRDWKSQADAVWDLKELVSTFNNGVAGWTAGQVRDEFIEADKLSLDALKYARAISETAPIVGGLVRTMDDELDGTMQFQVLKVRNAPLPKRPILLHSNLDYMRIHQEIVSRVNLLDLEDEIDSRIPKGKKRRRGGKHDIRE